MTSGRQQETWYVEPMSHSGHMQDPDVSARIAIRQAIADYGGDFGPSVLVAIRVSLCPPHTLRRFASSPWTARRNGIEDHLARELAGRAGLAGPREAITIVPMALQNPITIDFLRMFYTS
jgi:hypothetical protein